MEILVLDFGGTSVKYAVVDQNGTIQKSGKVPAPLESKEQFVDTVNTIYSSHKELISGLSLSMPGYVNPESGDLIGSGAYRALYGCNIMTLLQEAVPVNIAVENDGKCGALAEAWMGALADCNDGVVLILGSGIAGGIIKDKKIHAGNHLTAGEFSSYLVKLGDPTFRGLAVFNCAAFGLTYKLCKAKNLDFDCQDYAAELKGIDAAFGGDYPVFSEAPLQIKADGVQFYKWIMEGDTAAKDIYGDLLESLAFLIFNIQITFAPQKVVIGGGLSRIPCLLQDTQNMLHRFYQGTGLGPELQTTVVGSKYLDECNVIGAMYHYMLRFPE